MATGALAEVEDLTMVTIVVGAALEVTTAGALVGTAATEATMLEDAIAVVVGTETADETTATDELAGIAATDELAGAAEATADVAAPVDPPAT